MEFFLKFYLILVKIGRFFYIPILKLRYKRQQKTLPPLKNPLLKIPATELADKIKRQEITSEEVVKSYIIRIREVTPIINAVTDDRYKEAIVDARRADKMVQSMSPLYLTRNYPLLGVPVTVKEAIGVKGLNHAVGSLARKGDKAEDDGKVVKLLRAAGAIPVCVTNAPDWCMGFETYNLINGRTLNPHDLGRSPGGSSGGEAALMTTGASLIGVGSDDAGTLRQPALFCGVFAHKPTAKVVSLEGLFPQTPDKNYQSFATIGPMTRYAKDLKPMMAVMSDKNPKLRLDTNITTENIKIYFKYEINGVRFSAIGVDESIKTSMTTALEYFKGKGSSVQEAQIDLSKSFYIQAALMAALEDVPDIFSYRKKKRDWPFWEDIKSTFGFSQYTKLALAYTRLTDLRSSVSLEKGKKYSFELGDLRKQFLKLLGDNGVFFFPTFPVPAFRHNESTSMPSAIIYGHLFNLLGFPATHVPMGVNKAGLPIGFQVVAAPFQDRLCFAIACELEEAFGGWTPPEFYKRI